MTRHLTFDELCAVRRCLCRGWRYVQIAQEFNLSIWTIAKIATEFRYRIDPVREVDLPVDDAPPDYLADNLRRCPGCGAMIYVWPCLACRLEAGLGVRDSALETLSKSFNPEPTATANPSSNH